MPRNRVRHLAVLAILVATAIAASAQQAPVDQVAPAAPAGGGHAWTLDEAQAHVRLYPRDAYMQYVALQLARREGKVAEVAAEIERRTPRRNPAGRTGQIELFSILSGSLAVQESLQLDAMTEEAAAIEGVAPVGRRVGPRALDGGNAPQRTPLPVSDVPLASLEGPTIKSHPWEEMLAGRKPEISRLARSVPDDFYFVTFRSVDKLIEASDLMSLWGAHLLNQSVQQAEAQLVNQRLRQQLAVEISPALRPLYDSAVLEAALAGSDPFVREGSDVSLMFHVKHQAPFRAQMDVALANAEKSRPDARRTTGQILGVDFVHVATPDRKLYVFSAYPHPDVHVRTNSRVALARIVAAIRGKDGDGKPVTRLGDTTEYAYIRTLLPPRAEEEDGLVYLSDPFIRQLVGPKLRLVERRRLGCYNHLRMIGHAALLHRTERGATPASLAAIHQADCCPHEFGTGNLVCPEGGEYSLAADGLTGVCSHHGYASHLTPCCEIETSHVTKAEAEAYRQFLEGYNNYWRTFFDPIAIRLQISAERYRAETIVLPLINNSVYQGLASALGGAPENLDAVPIAENDIFTLAVRYNKRELLRQAGFENLLEAETPVDVPADAVGAINSLRELSLAMLNYESAMNQFPTPAIADAAGRPLLSWRVAILPYLGEQELYQEFHLDESWDSPHNKQLIGRMPAVFRPSDRQLAEDGKTKMVLPIEKDGVMTPDNKSRRLREITDGLSQTILIVEADDLHAATWTKADDLAVDLRQPHVGLEERSNRVLQFAFGDGSVHSISSDISRDDLASLMTRAGEESPDWRQFDRSAPPRRGLLAGYSDKVVRELKLGELLSKGVGNQIGFHVCDADPMFDLSLSRLLGMSVQSMRGAPGIDDDFLGIGLLVASLNSPVYVSIPVVDREIVDGFLERLDVFLANMAQQESWDFFFSIDQDFYNLQMSKEHPVRSYGVRFGPIKWRFFWSRIGDAVYVASKPEVLRDLMELEDGEPRPATDGADTTAHAMAKVRPEHWKKILPHFQLGWEENSREACLRNLGPLSSLSRALAADADGGQGDVSDTELQEHAERLYDVRYFCPDEGHYVVAPDGQHVTCSHHGSAGAPRQPAAPSPDSRLGRVIGGLKDATVTLTFLEDGLHAVVTLERQDAAAN